MTRYSPQSLEKTPSLASTSHESAGTSFDLSPDLRELATAIERGQQKAKYDSIIPRQSDAEIEALNTFFLNGIDINKAPILGAKPPKTSQKDISSQTITSSLKSPRAPVSLFYGEHQHKHRLSKSSKEHAKNIRPAF